VEPGDPSRGRPYRLLTRVVDVPDRRGRRRRVRDRPAQTPLHGIWDVQEVTRDGVAVPLLITDRNLWRRLVLPWAGPDGGDAGVDVRRGHTMPLPDRYSGHDVDHPAHAGIDRYGFRAADAAAASAHVLQVHTRTRGRALVDEHRPTGAARCDSPAAVRPFHVPAVDPKVRLAMVAEHRAKTVICRSKTPRAWSRTVRSSLSVWH
jgi:hypothetical protein